MVADCGTADAAPVTPFDGVVIGTPEGVFAGSVPFTDPFVVLVIGDEFGFTIGVEFGFGIGVVVMGTPLAEVVPLVVADGLTIGLEFGFGFGLELGFGVGELVTGGVAAAGFPEALVEVPAAVLFAAAGLLLPAGAVPLLLGVELGVPLEPFDPLLPPPVLWAKDTAATEPISNAAMVLERETLISPPCRRAHSKVARTQNTCVNR